MNETVHAKEKKAFPLFSVIGGVTALLIIVALVSSGVNSFTGGEANPFVTVSFIAALIGGFLSLISPCSAAMLPVFFAYSFKQKSQLLKMTFVFYLGLATIFVPLGFASTFVSTLFIEHPNVLFTIAGAIFIFLGLMLFLGKSFQLLPERFRTAPQGKGMGTVYVMGLLFAFASGTCAAPIIGGIFTIAATSGNALQGVLLLLTYALGMVGPLLIMAWFFDRYNFSKSKVIQGKSWDMQLFGKTYHLHSTNLIASLLFIGVGLIFIFSRGTNSFLGAFEESGATDFYYEINLKLLEVTSNLPSWPLWVLIAAIVAYIVYRKRTKKKKESKNNEEPPAVCEIPPSNQTDHTL